VRRLLGDEIIGIECAVVCVRTYYWFELVPFATMFAINSATPPSSRKFCTTSVLLTLSLVEARPPLKNGRRSTRPVIISGVRMP
jgi:hypothetical protein